MLGSVGTYRSGARGIKVISAIALSPEGEPIGLCDQQPWMRPPKPKTKRPIKRRVRGTQQAKEKQRQRKKRLASQKAQANATRPVQQKETQHWIDAIVATKHRFDDHAPGTQCWFQIDREGDAWPILLALSAPAEGNPAGGDPRPDDLFTVRSNWDRCLSQADGSPRKLRDGASSSPRRILCARRDMATLAIRSIELPSGGAIPVLGQGTWRFGEDRERREDEILALRLGLDLGMIELCAARELLELRVLAAALKAKPARGKANRGEGRQRRTARPSSMRVSSRAERASPSSTRVSPRTGSGALETKVGHVCSGALISA
jgi:hypothetical protein